MFYVVGSKRRSVGTAAAGTAAEVKDLTLKTAESEAI